MRTFKELSELFDSNRFREIDSCKNAKKFYFLRSISRTKNINDFCVRNDLDFAGMKLDEKLEQILSDNSITTTMLRDYIQRVFEEHADERNIGVDNLVKELNRVQEFDWGGSYGNSLEKNIVNNYIKKIDSYDKISTKIENELLASLRGYTINSWYNHWSSILIEDIFKSHKNVLPTIGLVKKIDFFINETPFDLKVTYFPEELMKQKLREKGFGVELTRVKQVARGAGIPIDSSLKDKALNVQLQSLLKEQGDDVAQTFLAELRKYKKEIISEALKSPNELIRWLYENQGEARFDASNRLFLVLVDAKNYYESWKLKRNFRLLKSNINSALNEISDREFKQIDFYWRQNGRTYTVNSDIVFIVN